MKLAWNAKILIYNCSVIWQNHHRHKLKTKAVLLFRLYLHVKLSLIEKVRSDKMSYFSCSQSWGSQSTRTMFYFQLVMFRPMNFYEKRSEKSPNWLQCSGPAHNAVFVINFGIITRVVKFVKLSWKCYINYKNDTRFTKIFNKQM